MWESVHALPDFDIDVSIRGHLFFQTVLLYKVLWEVAEFQSHVFIAGHRGVQIEIFNVNCHKFCTRCGDDTVQQEFNGEEIDCRRATVAGVVNPVATDGEASLVWIVLFGPVVHDHTPIRDVSPYCCKYFALVDE